MLSRDIEPRQGAQTAGSYSCLLLSAYCLLPAFSFAALLCMNSTHESDGGEAGGTPVKSGATPQPGSTPKPPGFFQTVGAFAGVGGPLSAADLAVFAETLSALVRARLPLPDALKMLAKDASNPRLRAALEAVERDVAAGVPLGEAMRRREQDFPTLFVKLIDQGAASNDLHSALLELIREYRSQMRFREALFSQLFSPIATMTCLATLVMIAVMAGLPPSYAELLRKWRPWRKPTTTLRAAIWLTSNLDSFALVFAAMVIVAVIVLVLIIRRPSARRQFQLFVLGLPVMGPYLRTMLLGRFCRLLGVLLARNIPIDSALEFTGNCMTFIPMRECVDQMRQRLSKGASLDTALTHPLIPPTLLQFIRSAQIHGELPATLSRLADVYEERGVLEGARLRLYIFVIAQVSVGLLVGGAIVTFFIPMFYW